MTKHEEKYDIHNLKLPYDYTDSALANHLRDF